jgi:integrase
LDGTSRAKRKHDVPTVLTREEVHAVLNGLAPPYKLFSQLLYGCGLRLNEALTLRVQDLDLKSGSLVVFNGKGNKSRSLPLPKKLIPTLQAHLDSIALIFEEDKRRGFAGVLISASLGRKYPNAAREWPWQWVFPAKLSKRVSAHTFRHSFATRLLQMGYDIRTVQELMGHADVTTTMIYTHALQSLSGKVISPLDL